MNKRQKKKLLKKKLKGFGCKFDDVSMIHHSIHDMNIMVNTFSNMLNAGNNRSKPQYNNIIQLKNKVFK